MSNLLRIVFFSSLALTTLMGCPDNDKQIDTGTRDYAYVVIIPTDNSNGLLHRATFLARGGGSSSDQLQFTQATGLSDDNTVLEIEPGEVFVEANAVMDFHENNGETDGSSSYLTFTEVLNSCEMAVGEVNTVTAEVYCPADATDLSDCDFDFGWSADPDHDRDSGCATLSDTSTDDGDDSAGGGLFDGRFGFGG
jgi:hypothetical protein